MTLDLLGYIALTTTGLTASAIFSGMETGLYTINRVRLAVQAEHGLNAALHIRTLIERPNRMLATLLIGNNTANYAGSFGIAAILDHFGVLPVSAILINVCVLVPLLFVFGETLPKDLFRTHTDRWSYALAGALIWWDRLLMVTGLSPLVQGFGVAVARLIGAPAALPAGARQRISQLIKEGVAAGVLSESQTTLADRVLSMRDVRVARVAVPWRKVAVMPINAEGGRRTDLIRRGTHARMPVVDQRGRPVGVLTVLDAMLEPNRPTRELMQPVIEIESGAPVRAALRQMRTSGSSLAIVTSRKGGLPIGIVTFKDLIEPLTGELHAW